LRKEEREEVTRRKEEEGGRRRREDFTLSVMARRREGREEGEEGGHSLFPLLEPNSFVDNVIPGFMWLGSMYAASDQKRLREAKITHILGNTSSPSLPTSSFLSRSLSLLTPYSSLLIPPSPPYHPGQMYHDPKIFEYKIVSLRSSRTRTWSEDIWTISPPPLLPSLLPPSSSSFLLITQASPNGVSCTTTPKYSTTKLLSPRTNCCH
jgi:hypothetical protein